MSKVKVGDIKMLDNIKVKVIDIFSDCGIKYAEIKPVDFESFSREVRIDRLK